MKKNVKGWAEYFARLAFLFSGLILAIYGIQAMIHTMPEHRIIFIIFAFIFLTSWTITSWIELRRIRKRVINKEEEKENKVEYPITVSINYTRKLSRLTTFFRVFMVIPHAIVLWALGIAAGVIAFITWWAILFTGTYPQWAFDFIAGYIRWYTRVSAYYLLVTDKYPPFSIE